MILHRTLASLIKILPVLACLCLVPPDVLSQDETESNGAPMSLNKCWTADTAEPVNGSIASDSERLYVPLTGGGIQAINLKDGRSSWSEDLGGELGARILVNGRALYAVSVSGGPAGSMSAVLRSISKQTGVTNWSQTLPGSGRFFLGEAAGGLIVVSATGQIELRSAEDGRAIWRTTVAGPVTVDPYFADGTTIVGTGQKVFFVISNSDGRVIARTSLKYPPTAISVNTDGQIITGDERGNLALRDADGEVHWNFRNGARISSVSHTKHGILAVSHDNFVYLLSNGSGSVIWKRRLPGRVVDRPALAGDIVVATTVADGRAFIIDIETGRLINQMPIDSSDLGGLRSLLVSEHSIAFSLPGEVRVYSSQACTSI